MNLTYAVVKEVTFEASHVLMGLPKGHKCGRLHGHNYRVEVHAMAARLDDTGFVIDFGVISELVRGYFDHQHLNDVLGKMKIDRNPTAEVLAEVIMSELNRWLLSEDAQDDVKITCVTVWETETCRASVHRMAD